MKKTKQKHNRMIRDFIKEKSALFWYVQESQKENLSIEAIVETILNYGDEKDVKRLFDLVGIKRASEIFYKQTCRPRVNYFPQVINFFNHYFIRHA